MSLGSIAIYSSPACGWAIRNYGALIEKGIPFEVVMAKDPDGRKTEEFLALSPYDKTPVLTVNGEVVWDSLHINLFIDECMPGPGLMPDKPAERARAQLWMRHCDHELFPLLTNLAAHPDDQMCEQVGKGLLELAEYGQLDRSSGAFWTGPRIGLVDMCYSTLFDTIDAYGQIYGPGWLDIPEPLVRWRDAIRAHPTMKTARQIQKTLSLATPRTFVPARMKEKHASHR